MVPCGRWYRDSPVETGGLLVAGDFMISHRLDLQNTPVGTKMGLQVNGNVASQRGSCV